MKRTPLKRKTALKRGTKKLRKTGKSPLTKAKKRAWAAFSLYIRTKYMNPDGTLTCYTCGNTFDFKKMSAGHGIGGRNNAVLLMEEIVRPQCAGCNLWGHGQYRIFTRKLIDELGVNKYDELVQESNQTVKFTVEQWQEKEQYYKELLKQYD